MSRPKPKPAPNKNGAIYITEGTVITGTKDDGVIRIEHEYTVKEVTPDGVIRFVDLPFVLSMDELRSEITSKGKYQIVKLGKQPK